MSFVTTYEESEEELGYKVVKEYRSAATEPDPLLRDNPMALVFPPPMDDKALMEALQQLPMTFPEGWKGWLLSARLGLLEQMNSCHCVFDYEFDIVNKAMALARASLRTRSPHNPEVMRAILKIAAGEDVKLPRFGNTGGGGGLGILIVGISGVGKSSLLDRICSVLGAFGRVHKSINGRPARWPQLGVVRINIDRTLAGTLKEILTEVNRQSGRKLHYVPTQGRISDLKRRVRKALSMGWASLLILDEVQRLVNISPKVAGEVLDVAIDIMVSAGVPVVLVGTELLRRLLLTHKSQLTKFQNGGTRTIGPLEEFDEDTARFIWFLKRYSVSTTDIAYSPDFDHMLWAHSMGVKRIMVEYMRCVFYRHATDETIAVDAALLQSISEDEMKDFEPVVSVLRKSKLGMKLTSADYKQYEDFLAAALKKRRQTRPEFRVQAHWENETPIDDDGERLMSAEAFLETREQLRKERALDDEKSQEEAGHIEDLDAAAQAALAESASEAESAKEDQARQRAEARVKKGLSTASQRLKEVGKVVSLSSVKRGKGGADEGVDPSDIR